MNLMISGSHGLIGTALVQRLEETGHTIIRLERTINETLEFNNIDAVVHLAGESIADGRWNTEKKQRIEQSRVIGTTKLTEQIAATTSKPAVFICASAIGFYGNRGETILAEDSTKGSGYLPDVCEKWEQSASGAGIRTVNLRTGIVLDKKGGALQKMLPPFKLGLGGILGSGNQYMSWISLEDMITAIQFIISNQEIEGPVNLTSPNPVTNKDFTKTLGTILRRPSIMPLPAFAARIIFGEMANALLLSSARVQPKKLLNAGYNFQHTELRSALKDILK